MRSNFKFTFETDYSIGRENCQNILIKGDNKEILPELIKEFGGKVKCVYIDPPYNNGDSYSYYNDKVSEATWLRDLRCVLTYLHMLLTKDGSIWISIDDGEMAYLKVEADKIFGRENFAATIVWQQRKTRENRAVFSRNHEYILVYAKDLKKFKKSRNLLPVDKDYVNSKYRNPDNDPRGPWQSVSASVQAGHAVPSQFYTITSPSGAEFNPPKGRCWVYNKERMDKEIENGNIWFGLDGCNVPRIKKYLSSAKIGLTPQTLWCGDEYGTTDSAKKHLLSLFPNHNRVFDTPKPEELINQILQIATNEGDLVLDCYLGSGTTLAAAHKSRRHYIGIELGDQMTDLVINRLHDVVKGEGGGISNTIGWNGGGEFAYFTYNRNAISPIHTSKVSKNNKEIKPTCHQLNLFSLFDEFGENPICENTSVNEVSVPDYLTSKTLLLKELRKNVLIALVKKDNERPFIDSSATLYYAGKKFPSTVALNHLYYFIPYIKGKGIRDLYLIQIARIGRRKEGQEDENGNDLRLVFEIRFIKQLNNDYFPIDLKIWRTYTDTSLEEIMMELPFD